MAVGCAACGGENEPDAKFCVDCGAALPPPSPTSCPSCGAPASRGRFCAECGGALAPDVVARQPHDERSKAAPLAERRLTSILFGDLVGFTALAEGRDLE